MRASSLVLLVLVTCTPLPASDLEPRTENSPEACELACERLRSLGCPEGSGSLSGESCMRVCLRASTLRALPVSCWAEASTVAAARACGSLRCLR